MPIIFACHDCGQPFQRPQKDAGRRARCTCGAEVIVPEKTQERIADALAARSAAELCPKTIETRYYGGKSKTTSQQVHVSMHVACPTCAHSFKIDDSRFNTPIDCPKCQLSFRGQDNLVPEFKPEEDSPTDKFPQIAAGICLAGILFLVFAFASISNTEDSSPKPRSKPSVEHYANELMQERPVRTLPPRRVGKVDYSLIATMRNAWRKEGWRSKPRYEVEQAMALLVLVVQTDIEDPLDQQATLNYIQENIDSW